MVWTTVYIRPVIQFRWVNHVMLLHSGHGHWWCWSSHKHSWFWSVQLSLGPKWAASPPWWLSVRDKTQTFFVPKGRLDKTLLQKMKTIHVTFLIPLTLANAKRLKVNMPPPSTASSFSRTIPDNTSRSIKAVSLAGSSLEHSCAIMKTLSTKYSNGAALLTNTHNNTNRTSYFVFRS